MFSDPVPQALCSILYIVGACSGFMEKALIIEAFGVLNSHAAEIMRSGEGRQHTGILGWTSLGAYCGGSSQVVGE